MSKMLIIFSVGEGKRKQAPSYIVSGNANFYGNLATSTRFLNVYSLTQQFQLQGDHPVEVLTRVSKNTYPLARKTRNNPTFTIGDWLEYGIL